MLIIKEQIGLHLESQFYHLHQFHSVPFSSIQFHQFNSVPSVPCSSMSSVKIYSQGRMFFHKFIISGQRGRRSINIYKVFTIVQIQ